MMISSGLWNDTEIDLSNRTRIEAPGGASRDEHYLDQYEVIIALVCIYCADVFVICANTFVISAFVCDRSLQVPRNYYIVNVALCDLVIGVFVVPVYSSTVVSGDWLLGVYACVVWNVVNNIVLAVSHLSLLLVAYDRYLLVSDVVRYNNTETVFRAKLRLGESTHQFSPLLSQNKPIISLAVRVKR